MSSDHADARRALALLDLTDLDEHTAADRIDRLCTRAVGPHGSTAAVCVWPRWVARAVEHLAGTGVLVATVVNFPSGKDTPGAVLQLTDAALADGAHEIDLVLPYRAFLAGRATEAATMVDVVRAHVSHGRSLKVILESGGYPDVDAVHRAARLAIDHGADFIKTSTGKTDVSATDAAVRAILHEIRATSHRVGIKPSGGIRSLGDAQQFLLLADQVMGEQWATPSTFRFGASGLLDVLEAVLAGESSHSTTDAY